MEEVDYKESTGEVKPKKVKNREELKEYKKLLIYLYEYFEHSQPKIFNELYLNRRLNTTKETVDLWFEETKTRLSNYLVFFEKNFPEGIKKNNYLVIHKYKDKPLKRLLGKKLKSGKTIKDFCIEHNIDTNNTIHYLNLKLDKEDKISM